jgi:phosphopantothenoylcysteine decarboxylase / phosphopantothenate---cysteine ligase
VHLISASGVEDWPTLAKGDVALRLASRIAIHFGQSQKAQAAE